MVVRTESLRIPNWHDTGSTSPRSVGEVALIWDTISHYWRVLIAPLAIISSRRRIQKKTPKQGQIRMELTCPVVRGGARLHAHQGGSAAKNFTERFAETSDSFPLHRGRRPY